MKLIHRLFFFFFFFSSHRERRERIAAPIYQQTGVKRPPLPPSERQRASHQCLNITTAVVKIGTCEICGGGGGYMEIAWVEKLLHKKLGNWEPAPEFK